MGQFCLADLRQDVVDAFDQFRIFRPLEAKQIIGPAALEQGRQVRPTFAYGARNDFCLLARGDRVFVPFSPYRGCAFDYGHYGFARLTDDGERGLSRGDRGARLLDVDRLTGFADVRPTLA